MPPESLWQFLPVGYLVTVVIEGPILWFGLSSRHGRSTRLLAGFGLTACTYPIVVLVLPILMSVAEGNRFWYLVVAETFAPLAECLLFFLAFGPHPSKRALARDLAVITLANLVSFGVGELLWLQSA